MLFVIFFSLIHQCLAACNSTAVQEDVIFNCRTADPSLPCPAQCQTSVQQATGCKPRSQTLNAVLETYAFCKPQAKCKLILKSESCNKPCHWCNNKCQAGAIKCQNASSTSTESNASSSTSTSSSSTCKDDPDGLVAQQGYDCSTILAVTSNNCDFDLSAISPQIPKGVTPGQICPKSCQRCGDSAQGPSSSTAQGYSTPAAQNSSSPPTQSSPAATKQTCPDDPQGMVARQNLTCASLLQHANNNCDIALSSIIPNAPQGLTPAQLCPKSCKRCNSSGTPKPATQAKPAAQGKPACVDDPTGMVAKYGFTCATVLGATGNNCDQDLNTLSPSIPKGVTPGQLCPKSCARCADASGKTAPAPQRITGTYINGHLITPTEKQWLTGLGVQPLPPGRYFLLSDGSVGLEGGPTLLNVYHVAGQKINTALLGNTGVTKAADQTKNGVNDAVSGVKTAAQTTRQNLQSIGATISGFFHG